MLLICWRNREILRRRVCVVHRRVTDLVTEVLYFFHVLINSYEVFPASACDLWRVTSLKFVRISVGHDYIVR